MVCACFADMYILTRGWVMISNVQPGVDAVMQRMNEMLKTVVDAQSNLAEKMLKVCVTQQVERVQAEGLGEALDLYI